MHFNEVKIVVGRHYNKMFFSHKDYCRHLIFINISFLMFLAFRFVLARGTKIVSKNLKYSNFQ